MYTYGPQVNKSENIDYVWLSVRSFVRSFGHISCIFPSPGSAACRSLDCWLKIIYMHSRVFGHFDMSRCNGIRERNLTTLKLRSDMERYGTVREMISAANHKRHFRSICAQVPLFRVAKGKKRKYVHKNEKSAPRNPDITFESKYMFIMQWVNEKTQQKERYPNDREENGIYETTSLTYTHKLAFAYKMRKLSRITSSGNTLNLWICHTNIIMCFLLDWVFQKERICFRALDQGWNFS